MTNVSQESGTESVDGWHWGIGERSSGYYDKWLYTNRVLYPDGEFGYEGHAYWDEGGKHHVEFYQYTRWDPEGDHEVDYPSHTASFDTEEEAEEYLLEKAKKLRQFSYNLCQMKTRNEENA